MGMLVLTRTRDEKIILTDRRTGQQIAEITLVDIRDNRKARIGITAPGVQIDREEILKQRAAAGTPPIPNAQDKGEPPTGEKPARAHREEPMQRRDVGPGQGRNLCTQPL